MWISFSSLVHFLKLIFPAPGGSRICRPPKLCQKPPLKNPRRLRSLRQKRTKNPQKPRALRSSLFCAKNPQKPPNPRFSRFFARQKPPKTPENGVRNWGHLVPIRLRNFELFGKILWPKSAKNPQKPPLLELRF